jgi:hypothetical protein
VHVEGDLAAKIVSGASFAPNRPVCQLQTYLYWCEVCSCD